MSQTDFDRFLNSYTKEKKEIDIEKVKKEWLEQLEVLYKNINKWLEKFISEKKVEISYNNYRFTEDGIGSYFANIMIIHFADQEVKLNPIGTMIIGAKGRVDFEGKKGKARFVLVDEDLLNSNPQNHYFDSRKKRLEYEEKQKNIPKKTINLVWKIATPPPNMSFIELDESTFFDALMEVIDA
jgi:hypothetical protein